LDIKDDDMNNVNSAKRWETLDDFSLAVSSGPARLFANGGQEVKVRVAIKAVDVNGDPVQLSSKEIDSLELIDYHNTERVVQTTGAIFPRPPASKWRWSYKRNNKYRFFPTGQSSLSLNGEMSMTDLSINSSTQYRDVYVRTTADAPLHLSARIKRDDGVAFTAHFDSSVTLTPVTPPTYRAADYTFQPLAVENALDYRPFALNVGGVNIEFVSFSMPSLVKHGGKGSLIPVVFTGCAEPGQTEIRYTHPISIGPRQIKSGYVKKGQPIVAVSKPILARPDQLSAQRREAPIAATDMYGNKHSINVRFKTVNDFNSELELY
jgi:hypothetical protein